MHNQIINKAILFDLDGTLVDLRPPSEDLSYLREKVVECAFQWQLKISTNSIFGVYQIIVDSLGYNHPASVSIREELDKCEIKWAEECVVPVVDLECVEQVHQNGYFCALITNNGRKCIQALFRKKILKSHWFDVAITRDDTTRLKPSKDPLGLFMEYSQTKGASISQIIFVGDSENDRLAVNAYNQGSSLQIEYCDVNAKQMVKLKGRWFV